MKWLRLSLQTIGALSVLLFLIAAILVGSDLYSGMSDKFNRATPKDVLFVLNWGGISTNQTFKVIGSYQSRRSFTGDHVDYYCIELPKFEVTDLQKNEWHDAPEENPLLAQALEVAVNGAHEHIDCFPPTEKANSKAMKLKFVSVTLNDRFATAADIILYDRDNGRLYYVSFKT